ncbi:hypothetical protein TeGR_g5383 [Tetraparma gracilis]|uniref:Uncharacterized protein n=1 Tax=Tetraparma gracilis TaxID=2962635 RepID=A0ABQ6MHB4_9STRA|nr:hypothetical protein TeGR_g5383 [Tetraparma gracilis]
MKNFIAALAIACRSIGALACTTTNQANTNCAALTDATIGNSYNGAANTAIVEWFADEAAATAKWGHISDWYTGDVTTMYRLFYNTGSFDEDISGWDTSKVTNMQGMFQGASVFDQDISGLDTSKCTNMGGMFQSASVFDQDISGWDTSKCTNMNGMFYGATAFSQDISPWCVALISSEPTEFGNAGADPNWGAACGTPCTTGADGTECQNGGAATGIIPTDSQAADNCSCDCTGTGYEDATCSTEVLDAEGSASKTTAVAAALAAAAVSALMLQ